MPSASDKHKLNDFYIESPKPRELVQSYHKVLNELDLQRKANLELCRDKQQLETEVQQLRREIADCRVTVGSEAALRER